MNLRSDFVAQLDLSREERDLIHDLLEALQTIRHGAIALTIPDGKLIEIQKAEKIRRKALNSKNIFILTPFSGR
jgi:hypothetical protein